VFLFVVKLFGHPEELLSVIQKSIAKNKNLFTMLGFVIDSAKF
jgi:hypothetical protein